MLSPSTFTSIINSYLPEPHASLLSGMLLGVDIKTSRIFYQELRTIGLLHLVVLSGTNIMLLIATTTSLTRFFGRYISLVLGILIIILFIIFVSPEAPIVRAGIMGILTSVSFLYGRRTYALYSLLLAALITALFWPQWLTTISFQLSYGATLGLILFGPKKIPEKKGFHGALNFLATPLKISLAAQVFTTPLIFLYFKQISLISPVANVLVAGIVSPIMGLGMIALILHVIHPVLATPFFFFLYGLLEYMVVITHYLSRIPYALISF